MVEVDLKVIVGVILVLIILATATGNTEQARDVLGKAWERLRSGTGDVALPSLGASVPAKIRLESNAVLQPDGPTELVVNGQRLTGFKGAISYDAADDAVELSHGGLELAAALGNVTGQVRIGSFTTTDARFTLFPNVTATNGSLALKGFTGSLSIDKNGVTLDGNVTELRTSIGGRGWELR